MDKDIERELRKYAGELVSRLPTRGISRATQGSSKLTEAACFFIIEVEPVVAGFHLRVSPNFVRSLYSKFESMAPERVLAIRGTYARDFWDYRIELRDEFGHRQWVKETY